MIYGTVLKIDKYRFMDGENCADHSARRIIFIEKVTVLVHRNVFGDPKPLTNVEKKKASLINLNLKDCPSRVFYSTEQLENSLVSVQDLKNQPNGKCSLILKLTVIKKFPIAVYSSCRILNINMKDSTGMVRVSAFNSLSENMDKIFEENKSYYITDTVLKHNGSNYELKLQSYSVVIECVDRMGITTEVSNFHMLLEKNPNTFCDLIGLCIEVRDVEVCCNSNTRTEIAKREIVLIDASMTTITLKVWGENVHKFDERFEEPPIVAIKNAILKQFNGFKHFSMIKCSVLTINPKTVEARQLKEWYKEEFIVDSSLWSVIH